MATSYNGYPAITSSSGCKKWSLPVGKGPARHVYLAPGSPGFILAHLAVWFDRHIENLNDPQEQWDDWGWAYRNTRGSSTLSNHASGTALDLNATKHPLSKRGTFAKWQYVKMRAKLWRTYRGCIRWGADYTNRADEMHFEINRPRHEVIAVAAKLRKTKIGRELKEMNNA